MTKMFISLFFLFSIHYVISASNHEDLSISNYSHVGCLTLNTDKQFLDNYVQENALFPYQTYSSPNMTIELCFRLCRRWTILINQNYTNCICLYMMSVPYEFNEYLGEVSPIDRCAANDLLIYSLSKDSYILPSLSSIYDWSLDGCYYLYTNKTYQAGLFLNNVTYTKAIEFCRQSCQAKRNASSLSFFLSLEKSCYCSSNQLLTRNSMVLRKPLIHCSLVTYLKNGLGNILNDSEINLDTVIKIDVERYCASQFIFVRNLYLCLNVNALDKQNTYSKLSTGERCLPLSIKTYQQWNHLISFSFPLRSTTFIWIDRNSNYIFDDLFKSKNSLLTSDDYCITVNRTNSKRSPSFDLVPCSTAQSSDSVMCAQKPTNTNSSNPTKFKFIHNKKQSVTGDSFYCPAEFVSFNNMCYYVYESIVFNVTSAEHLCSEKYSNSTLVKFNSHDEKNVNTTFLGRKFDDVLLEFFYYELEKKNLVESKFDSNKNDWFQLLLGVKNDQNKCVIRSFTRSSGAFTVVHRCNDGGHPVCQWEPIPNNIFTKISTNETLNSTNQKKEIDINTNSLTDENTLTNRSNEITTWTCENCTTLIPDNNTSTERKKPGYNYRALLVIISGPLVALLILIIGTVFLIRYVRRSRGSYSTQRTKRSSTTATSVDQSNTPVVVYSRLKAPPPAITVDADNAQLLPKHHENIITKKEEESFYARLEVPDAN